MSTGTDKKAARDPLHPSLPSDVDVERTDARSFAEGTPPMGPPLTHPVTPRQVLAIAAVDSKTTRPKAEVGTTTLRGFAKSSTQVPVAAVTETAPTIKPAVAKSSVPLFSGPKHVVPAAIGDKTMLAIPQQAPLAAPVVSLFGSPKLTAVPTGAETMIAMPQMAVELPALPAANDKYSAFEKIGLGPNKKASGAAHKLIVSAYKLLGFAILTMIVVVLVGYIASTIFYYASKTWVTPTVVSGADDKIVQLKTELAAQQNNRDKLLADLHESERAIAAEHEFQIEFGKAIKADLEGRKLALDRVRQLAGAAASTRDKIRETNEDYAKASADKMQKDYDAHLIDEKSKLGGNYQLAQISTSTLSLAERQAELERQAQDLSAQTRSLDAILAQKDTALSYDVLKIKRDYDASKLALAKAMETEKTVTASLARQDEIIAGLSKSSYLRALGDHATVALVPYTNLENATPGASLYACKLAMFWCHEVGTVTEVLPGEIQFKHPRRDTIVRGQMVEMRLFDTSAGEDDVLFVGGSPLGF